MFRITYDLLDEDGVLCHCVTPYININQDEAIAIIRERFVELELEVDAVQVVF